MRYYEIGRNDVTAAQCTIRLTATVLRIYEAVYCGLWGIFVCHRYLARALYTGVFGAACQECYAKYEDYHVFHRANISIVWIIIRAFCFCSQDTNPFTRPRL
jgi:hypothetical protein